MLVMAYSYIFTNTEVAYKSFVTGVSSLFQEVGKCKII